jgi:primosomal protein N' (replication factor Y)
MSGRGIHIAVDVLLNERFTYLEGDLTVERGDVVYVPFGLGNKKKLGVVVKVDVPIENLPYTLKTIASFHEEWPRLSETHMKWLEWISEYYMHPIGWVLKLCFPPMLKKTEKSKNTKSKVKRQEVIPDVPQISGHELNIEQKQCVNAISSKKGFATHLLYGVTGSGKTEVYLELFEQTLKANKRGIFLLPEISLTPQLIQRFVRRFGNEIAVIHSQLTPRERTNQWWDIVEGRKKILIGARSAIFCPIEDLGLIVIDEEHESGFKQDEMLKYSGRDAAIMLGRFFDCPVILGSATPSLESWKNAHDKKFEFHQMQNRVNARPLPEITVVDMRTEKDLQQKYFNKPYWLSQVLYENMINALEKNEQVALLLNQRGVAKSIFCPSCGHSAECPNCDISLTLHASTHLVCHYCDYHENFKTKCPDCTEGERVTIGLGTEKVEDDLRKLFPEKTIARADRDEVQSRAEMVEIIERMEKSEIDILIGTQMIAKGLDFPNLNLVGLLLADVSFNLPDFRASEKSFQLITQMSGRAGRHVKQDQAPGKVFIQTYNPDHDSIVFSQRHDYEGFVNAEMVHRQQLNYPPFHRIASIKLQSPKRTEVQEASALLAQRAEALKNRFDIFHEIEVLGPAEAPIAKIRNQFRYHLLLKCGQHKTLNQFIQKLISDSKWIPKQTKVSVDVDPLNLL